MLMVFSFFLLIVSIAFFSRRGHGRFARNVVLISALLTTLFAAIEVGLSLITGEGVNDSVFYHAQTGLRGGDISQYAWPVTGLFIGLAIIGLLLVRYGERLPQAKIRYRGWNLVIISFATLAVVVQPAVVSTIQYSLRFIAADQKSDGFYDRQVSLVGEKATKNLVLIYLESVERTYFDETRFPGLTPNLKRLEAESISFTDVSQTMGAGFTIGGMVASQCGVPLILSGGENSMEVNRFLAGANCLGDILLKANYQTAFLGGASLEFAGKGAFYKSHGFQSVEGLTELGPALSEPDYVSQWGLQDDTLFEFAGAKIDELSQNGRPFAITLLTLDTHHPNGHADTNKKCNAVRYGDGSNPMLNSIKCVDQLAGSFIREIQSSEISDDTLIVVMSDHLAMENTATNLLEAGPRRNLFFVIDPSKSTGEAVHKPATTLDVAPTVLGMLGFDASRLGFGVDLNGDVQTLAQRLGVSADAKQVLNKYLLGFQKVYTKLWDYPDITNGLYVNIEKGEIQFGNSSYAIPALLTFDDEFAIDGATLADQGSERTLTKAVIGLDVGTKMIWFDACNALDALSSNKIKLDNAKICLAYGKRGHKLDVIALERSDYKSPEDLLSMLSSADEFDSRSSELDALNAIALERGEIPFKLPVKGLATGDKGVVLQSSAFGAGASFIRRQTTNHIEAGDDTLLSRGITLSGVSADGYSETLSEIDQCDRDWDPSSTADWKSVIEDSRGRFPVFTIVVHDTAYCGDGSSIFSGPLANLPLQQLKSADMRQAYIGVITGEGELYEFLNRDFPKYRVFLDPEAGERPNFTRVSFSKSNLEQNTSGAIVSSTLNEITNGCELPVSKTVSPIIGKFQENVRYLGERMDEVISFGSGWWGTELNGIWMASEKANFGFYVPENPNGKLLRLEFAPFVQPDRQFELIGEGKVLAKGIMNGTTVISVDLSSLSSGAFVQLTLRSLGATADCPKVLLDSSDPRVLNKMLKSASISDSSSQYFTGAGVNVTPVETDDDRQPNENPPVFSNSLKRVKDTVSASIDGTNKRENDEFPFFCTQSTTVAQTNSANTLMPLNVNKNSARAISEGVVALEKGWWKFGSEYWAGARNVQMQILLPNDPSNLTLQLDTRTLEKTHVHVDVYHDGRKIGAQFTNDDAPLLLDVTSLPRLRPIKLEFVTSEDADSLCLYTIGVSDDKRSARFAISDLKLTSSTADYRNVAVAHGGGTVNNWVISNSYDALQANYNNFDVFELDLIWTTDGKLVCMHDWTQSYTGRFGGEPKQLDHYNFLMKVAQSPNLPQNCDLGGLARWLQQNPKKRVVLDVKFDVAAAYRYIAQVHPELRTQIIAQAYQPEEIELFRLLGFKDVIWTLYRFDKNVQKITKTVQLLKPAAIAMPGQWGIDGILSQVRDLVDIPVFVHTVNNAATISCLRSLGATGIYTDVVSQQQFDTIVPNLDACEGAQVEYGKLKAPPTLLD